MVEELVYLCASQSCAGGDASLWQVQASRTGLVAKGQTKSSTGATETGATVTGATVTGATMTGATMTGATADRDNR